GTTTLTVIVPPGATSITPILVEDISTGLQASSITSSSPLFTVTNSPVVTPNYYASVLGAGSNPVSIAIADFNDDGNADIATANSGSSDVSVRLGDGV